MTDFFEPPPPQKCPWHIGPPVDPSDTRPMVGDLLSGYPSYGLADQGYLYHTICATCPKKLDHDMILGVFAPGVDPITPLDRRGSSDWWVGFHALQSWFEFITGNPQDSSLKVLVTAVNGTSITLAATTSIPSFYVLPASLGGSLRPGLVLWNFALPLYPPTAAASNRRTHIKSFDYLSATSVVVTTEYAFGCEVGDTLGVLSWSTDPGVGEPPWPYPRPFSTPLCRRATRTLTIAQYQLGKNGEGFYEILDWDNGPTYLAWPEPVEGEILATFSVEKIPEGAGDIVVVGGMTAGGVDANVRMTSDGTTHRSYFRLPLGEITTGFAKIRITYTSQTVDGDELGHRPGQMICANCKRDFSDSIASSGVEGTDTENGRHWYCVFLGWPGVFTGGFQANECWQTLCPYFSRAPIWLPTAFDMATAWMGDGFYFKNNLWELYFGRANAPGVLYFAGTDKINSAYNKVLWFGEGRFVIPANDPEESDITGAFREDRGGVTAVAAFNDAKPFKLTGGLNSIPQMGGSRPADWEGTLGVENESWGHGDNDDPDSVARSHGARRLPSKSVVGTGETFYGNRTDAGYQRPVPARRFLPGVTEFTGSQTAPDGTLEFGSFSAGATTGWGAKWTITPFGPGFGPKATPVESMVVRSSSVVAGGSAIVLEMMPETITLEYYDGPTLKYVNIKAGGGAVADAPWDRCRNHTAPGHRVTCGDNYHLVMEGDTLTLTSLPVGAPAYLDEEQFTVIAAEAHEGAVNVSPAVPEAAGGMSDRWRTGTWYKQSDRIIIDCSGPNGQALATYVASNSLAGTFIQSVTNESVVMPPNRKLGKGSYGESGSWPRAAVYWATSDGQGIDHKLTEGTDYTMNYTRGIIYLSVGVVAAMVATTAVCIWTEGHFLDRRPAQSPDAYEALEAAQGAIDTMVFPGVTSGSIELAFNGVDDGTYSLFPVQPELPLDGNWRSENILPVPPGGRVFLYGGNIPFPPAFYPVFPNFPGPMRRILISTFFKIDVLNNSVLVGLGPNQIQSAYVYARATGSRVTTEVRFPDEFGNQDGTTTVSTSGFAVQVGAFDLEFLEEVPINTPPLGRTYDGYRVNSGGVPGISTTLVNDQYVKLDMTAALKSMISQGAWPPLGEHYMSIQPATGLPWLGSWSADPPSYYPLTATWYSYHVTGISFKQGHIVLTSGETIAVNAYGHYPAL